MTLLLTAACGTTIEPVEPASTPEAGETTSQAGVSLQNAKTGDLLADFSAAGIDGGTSKLSDYTGKAVLVTFWATWCGYCREEMPAFQQLKKAYGDELVVWAIDADTSEADDAASYAAEQGYDFVFAMDSEDVGSFLAGIPYSVVIGPDGTLVYAQSGSAGDGTYDVFAGYIDQALGR